MRHAVRGRKAGRDRESRRQKEQNGDSDHQSWSVWLALSLLREKLSDRDERRGGRKPRTGRHRRTSFSPRRFESGHARRRRSRT